MGGARRRPGQLRESCALGGVSLRLEHLAVGLASGTKKPRQGEYKFPPASVFFCTRFARSILLAGIVPAAPGQRPAGGQRSARGGPLCAAAGY